MKNALSIMAVFVASTIGLIEIAQATPITYDFTATDFDAFNGNPIPNTSVTGNFTLDGTTVTQIDLEIGSHRYTSDEVELQTVGDDGAFAMGGKLNGPNAVFFGTDDFALTVLFTADGELFCSSCDPYSFVYTVPEYFDVYSSNSLSISVAPPASVPAPSAAWLFSSGIIGLVGIALKRKA